MITMNGLQSKFNIRGIPLALSKTSRFRLTQIEQIFISLTIFLAVVSMIIYFDAKTIIVTLADAFGKYMMPKNGPFYILVALTVFVLACFILSKLTYEYSNIDAKVSSSPEFSSSLGDFKYRFQWLFSIMMLIIGYFPVKYLILWLSKGWDSPINENGSIINAIVLFVLVIIVIALMSKEFEDYQKTSYKNDNRSLVDPSDNTIANSNKAGEIRDFEEKQFNSNKIAASVFFSFFIILMIAILAITIPGATNVLSSIPGLSFLNVKDKLMNAKFADTSFLATYIYPYLRLGYTDMYSFLSKILISFIVIYFFIKICISFNALYTTGNLPELYKHLRINEVFISLATFGGLFVIMNLFTPKMFTATMLYLLKFALPFLCLALSGFLVYDTFVLSMLYRHDLVK
jgi:hypothetical protein